MIKWAKAKVCVYADSVLCVAKIEQNPGAGVAKWTGQIEDFKRYPSYQDAVGLDGERSNRIRLEIFPRIYNIDYSQGDPDGLVEEEHRAGELQGPDHL